MQAVMDPIQSSIQEEAKDDPLVVPIQKPEILDEKEILKSTKDYFKEIILNLNKDTVDLKDYKSFQQRYKLIQQKTQELEKARSQQLSKEAGLQFFNIGDKNKTAEINEEPPKIYTVAAKPVPRDNMDEKEDGEDATRYV